jgi:hypothetical protein
VRGALISTQGANHEHLWKHYVRDLRQGSRGQACGACRGKDRHDAHRTGCRPRNDNGSVYPDGVVSRVVSLAIGAGRCCSGLSNLAAQNKQKLNWRTSIVDLMKLLDLDSSLSARKQLAQELHFTGDMNDSASMNIWLHKQVMTKLAENGGKVPEELRH